ncbi:hypothetical protein FVW27_00260 [Desulfovibrio sp. XJ01]|nr:hypothetical protein [Nitratidesulfovibrio liaohensis]
MRSHLTNPAPTGFFYFNTPTRRSYALDVPVPVLAVEEVPSATCGMRSLRGLPEGPHLEEDRDMNWGSILAIAIAVLNVVKESIDD